MQTENDDDPRGSQKSTEVNMVKYTNLFAGEVKRHNTCKHHGFLSTGFKQTGPSPLSPRYPNGTKN